MTTQILKKINTANLNRAFVGFDGIFNELQHLNHSSNYPPYNIIKTDDDHYTIELAIAGFQKSDISIEVRNDTMTISSLSNKDEDTNFEYLHRGISSKDFTREFKLAEHVVVTDAIMTNGMLRIFIERVIPEEKKPKLIQISEG